MLNKLKINSPKKVEIVPSFLTIAFTCKASWKCAFWSNGCIKSMAASLLIKRTCVVFRHRSYRSAAQWSSWGQWKTGLTDGDQRWEPQAEHRTRPGNCGLLCHFALRPPQWPIRGRDQPIRRGRLCGLGVSGVAAASCFLHLIDLTCLPCASVKWEAVGLD